MTNTSLILRLTTSFSDLGFSDSSFSDLSFSDLSFSDLSELHTEVGMQLAGNKTISGNSSGLGHLKSVKGKLSCCIHMILKDKNLLNGKALIWINWNSQYKLNRKVKAAQIAITAFLAQNLAASDPLISSFKYSSMYANKDSLVGRSTLVGSLDLNSSVNSLLAGFKRPASEALYHQSLFGTRNTIGQGEAWYSANPLVKRPRFKSSLPVFPQRLGEKDCAHYMLTRTCKFGDNCIFDHPLWVPKGGITDWKKVPTVNDTSEPLHERQGVPNCSFFLKTQKCKFGPSCKFNHPKYKAATSSALENEGSELPERPFEPPCLFYMKNGVCKYGSACKFHHPKDISVATGGAGNVNGGKIDGITCGTAGSLAPSNPPFTLALLHNSKGLPIRPREADCPFYLKTGSCKYCATCRYNHPERYVMVPPAAIAATPALRMNIGACKYGATCKFDHPSPGDVMAVVTSQGASTTTGEERVQQARLQILKSDFEMLHMKEDETIDTFTTKLTTLVNKAASLGHTMEDGTLVRKLLNAVPDRYLQIVASIEQYSDLDEMSLDEAIGRLKTFKERLKYKNERQVNSQESLMFTRHEGQRKPLREYGHGRFNLPRGREQDKNDYQSKREERASFEEHTRDKSQVTCYRCHKLGHYAYECPNKRKNQVREHSNFIEEDLEPTLLMETINEKK
nr:zinc finger CCCH domain-containing protein 37 isoform X2 [Tanacetum cinerariifolium]